MNIGDKAPEILGKDEQGRDIRLSDYKGRKLVLYFYPKDNTSGCTAEACSLRDHYGELQGAGYEVVGVSKDSAASHVKFKEKHELGLDNLRLTFLYHDRAATLWIGLPVDFLYLHTSEMTVLA